jgi:hypothetical protein
MGARIGGDKQSDGEGNDNEAGVAAAYYLWKWIKMFSRSKTPFNMTSS